MAQTLSPTRAATPKMGGLRTITLAEAKRRPSRHHSASRQTQTYILLVTKQMKPALDLF